MKRVLALAFTLALAFAWAETQTPVLSLRAWHGGPHGIVGTEFVAFDQMQRGYGLELAWSGEWRGPDIGFRGNANYYYYLFGEPPFYIYVPLRAGMGLIHHTFQDGNTRFSFEIAASIGIGLQVNLGGLEALVEGGYQAAAYYADFWEDQNTPFLAFGLGLIR